MTPHVLTESSNIKWESLAPRTIDGVTITYARTNKLMDAVFEHNKIGAILFKRHNDLVTWDTKKMQRGTLWLSRRRRQAGFRDNSR